jgi:hypothetical protein
MKQDSNQSVLNLLEIWRNMKQEKLQMDNTLSKEEKRNKVKQGYKKREEYISVNGIKSRSNDSDARREQDVRKIIEEKWECKLQYIGKFTPIDFFVIKNEKLAGYIELKSRSNFTDTYPSLFMDINKWMHLQLASVSQGVPAYFFCQFIDQIKYIKVSEIDARRMCVIIKDDAGIREYEPVIEIPINTMKTLVETMGNEE